MHFWVIVLSFSGVSGLLHLHHAHGGACISKGSVPAELRRKFPINLSTTNIDIDGENDEHIHHGMDDKNPCWQDLYDYDCAMSTIYSASFVAKDWLRSMPCANGVEDCDMPEALSRPGHIGVSEVDVMEFLGIKRASDIVKEGEG